MNMTHLLHQTNTSFPQKRESIQMPIDSNLYRFPFTGE
jgi:hypothetical protein